MGDEHAQESQGALFVPLPPWMAEGMCVYVAEHPRAAELTAPLRASLESGGRRMKGERTVAELDWSQPPEMGTRFETILAPALVEVGPPVRCPARNGQPVQRGIRLHDYSRHTFATMQLSAGVHFMQVSQWLGHAQYSLTPTATGYRAKTEAR
ncbi:MULTISPECIES: hypothetical protein [unclassified Gordonia (in: high G+C Gram-positive bacteria)]|uniref:hypothetical protein n=1 Tax=unclassified Gordonia (in: high G+C Gram-positive bacteria) TaxID=2657482 RepID=UPI000B31DE55|nr:MULTISPECIES: hypothetical protein [unclassified Gordonia (in: high G+C Gram-positive bacteria)]